MIGVVRKQRGWARYNAQEPQPPDNPDNKRPPAVKIPPPDKRPADEIAPGSAPSTGEDVENVPRRDRRQLTPFS